MDGLCFSLRRAFNNPSLRHGMEDVGGVAGIGDVDVTAGVNDVGRVFGGPWCSASAATMGRGEKASATDGGIISATRSRRTEEAGIRK